MGCAPTYHETPLSTLFGSAITPPIDEKICVPDSTHCGDFSFECAIEQYKDLNFVDVAKATAQSVGQVAAFYATGGLSVASTILEGVGRAEQIPELKTASTALGIAENAFSLGSSLNWEAPMGLFDDFGSVVDFFDDMIDEVDWGAAVNLGSEVATQFISSQNQVQAIPAMAGVKSAATAAAGAIAKVGPTVGRTFFNKWPNLATAIQKMRNAGHNITRSKLHSMLKRFGPDFLITAGIMSAAAVAELALAGPGHRRMNPANARALRRATRRIKSFHRLCGDADVIKRRSCRKKC